MSSLAFLEEVNINGASKATIFPHWRKEGRNGGGVYVRGGGGTEERVLAEQLEGEAAEEPGGAVGVVAGAVVDVHGDEEDGDAGHGGGRDEPRRPAPVVEPRPDHLLLPVVVRGPGGGAGITSRQRGGALLLLVAALVGEGGGPLHQHLHGLLIAAARALHG